MTEGPHTRSAQSLMRGAACRRAAGEGDRAVRFQAVGPTASETSQHESQAAKINPCVVSVSVCL